jgi:hypothetical protein
VGSSIDDIEVHAAVTAASMQLLHSNLRPGDQNPIVVVGSRTSPSTSITSGSPDMQIGMGILIFYRAMNLLGVQRDGPAAALTTVQLPPAAVTNIKSTLPPPSPSPPRGELLLSRSLPCLALSRVRRRARKASGARAAGDHHHRRDGAQLVPPGSGATR